MDNKELCLKIEQKRKELNNLAACNLSTLCTKEVIRISHELDELIAEYLKFCKSHIDQKST